MGSELRVTRDKSPSLLGCRAFIGAGSLSWRDVRGLRVGSTAVQHTGGVYTGPLPPPQMLMQYLYYGGTESMEIPTADILQVCSPEPSRSSALGSDLRYTWGLVSPEVRALTRDQKLGTPPSPASLARPVVRRVHSTG